MAQYLEELRDRKQTVISNIKELMVLTKVLDESGIRYKWEIVGKGQYSVSI